LTTTGEKGSLKFEGGKEEKVFALMQIRGRANMSNVGWRKEENAVHGRRIEKRSGEVEKK